MTIESRMLEPGTSILAVIDVQERLMPAIAGGQEVIANAGRLVRAAQALDVPVVVTEQYPKGLGPTVAGLVEPPATLIAKTTFDSCGAPAFQAALPTARPTVVLAGCEAHVCLLQTALGLVARGRRVAVVRDAAGSRAVANRDAAFARLAGAGVELVTTEMVVFEWLGSSNHPAFKRVQALIK
jgi:nicotinamidase-related amidase